MFIILRLFANPNSKCVIRLFKSFVLPILEYGCSVWSPYLRKDIICIENVQRTFTRILYCKLNRASPRNAPSYENRLKMFKLEPLAVRRVKIDLINFKQILNSVSPLKFSNFFVLRPTGGRNSQFEIQIDFTKFNPYYHSYFMRIRRWSRLLPTSFYGANMSQAEHKEFLSKIKVV